MIPSIPTTHNGQRYRSRTEARWAVFFESQAIPFGYEREGYQTEAGWYVPDFTFTAAPRLTIFEVKPKPPTHRETGLLATLAKGIQAHVFVAHGPPAPDTVIWKVYSDRRFEPWFLALEHEGTAGYLVSDLWDARQALALRKCASPAGAYGFGPDDALRQAAAYHFPIHDDGPTKLPNGVRPKDKRDWKQRERRIYEKFYAEGGLKRRVTP